MQITLGEWEELLAEEQRLRSALAEANLKADKNQKRAVGRLWHQSCADILNKYARISQEDLWFYTKPQEVMMIYGKIASDLGAGRVPELLSDVKGKGTPPAGLSEKSDIEHATAYIYFAKSKFIDDLSPMKTIEQLFGVTRITAQNWSKRKFLEHLRVFEQSPDDFMKVMKHRSARYRRNGRSANAIENRAREKTTK